jgi:hypothetical protein
VHRRQSGRPCRPTASSTALYLEAWHARRSGYEACIAAHYVARHQPTPADTLHWNRLALAHADAAGSDKLRTFYPSLYLNLAKSHQAVGDWVEMRHYYDLAERSASILSDPGYSAMVAASELLK